MSRGPSVSGAKATLEMVLGEASVLVPHEQVPGRTHRKQLASTPAAFAAWQGRLYPNSVRAAVTQGPLLEGCVVPWAGFLSDKRETPKHMVSGASLCVSPHVCGWQGDRTSLCRRNPSRDDTAESNQLFPHSELC